MSILSNQSLSHNDLYLLFINCIKNAVNQPIKYSINRLRIIDIFKNMSLIKSTTIGKKLFLFVTAMDQNMIAKPNFELTEDCCESLPKFELASGSCLQNISETPIYDHLSELISDGKYSFLRKNTNDFYQVLNLLGSIQLPFVFLQELNVLKRFGYYYRHTLAVTSLVAKYGLDMGLAKKDLELYLQSAFIHDIGITRLPHSILFSSQQFKDDEEILMQQHPLISYILFGYYNQGKNQEIGNGILFHHCPGELRNSSDCRNKEKANEIAWMLFNMDIFDAMISSRPFRPAFSLENALDHLTKLNQIFSLPLDIVYWFEKKLKSSSLEKLESNLIPIKPTIDASQLN